MRVQLLDHLVRWCQLGCSACLARRSFQIRICSCAKHRHIPYERPARAPRNHCQPIWAFSVWATKTRWFLKHRDAGWGKESRYDNIEMVVSYNSAWCSFTDKAVAPNESTSKPKRHWPGTQSFSFFFFLLLLLTSWTWWAIECEFWPQCCTFIFELPTRQIRESTSTTNAGLQAPTLHHVVLN